VLRRHVLRQERDVLRRRLLLRQRGLHNDALPRQPLFLVLERVDSQDLLPETPRPRAELLLPTPHGRGKDPTHENLLPAGQPTLLR
jgi:hypothetical protein